MNSKRKIEINIVEVQTYKILIQINSIILTTKVQIGQLWKMDYQTNK